MSSFTINENFTLYAYGNCHLKQLRVKLINKKKTIACLGLHTLFFTKILPGTLVLQEWFIFRILVTILMLKKLTVDNIIELCSLPALLSEYCVDDSKKLHG